MFHRIYRWALWQKSVRNHVNKADEYLQRSACERSLGVSGEARPGVAGAYDLIWSNQSSWCSFAQVSSTLPVLMAS